jgi:hypothetical protein
MSRSELNERDPREDDPAYYSYWPDHLVQRTALPAAAGGARDSSTYAELEVRDDADASFAGDGVSGPVSSAHVGVDYAPEARVWFEEDLEAA